MNNIIDRVPSGIDGFDELVQGGFPKNSCILVAGAPGTGKTIFGLEYLYNGAAKHNERGLFVTLEQKVEDLMLQARAFGWDFDKMVEEEKIKFMFLDVAKYGNVTGHIQKEVEDGGYKRLVIDSLNTLSSYPLTPGKLNNAYKFLETLANSIPIPLDITTVTRMQIHEIITAIKDMDCTSIVISELLRKSEGMSRDEVSEFLVDGVLTLHYILLGTMTGRTLMIQKMRHTKHSEDVHPMDFADAGIKIVRM